MRILIFAMVSMLLVGFSSGQVTNSEKEEMNAELEKSTSKKPQQSQVSDISSRMTDLENFDLLRHSFQSDSSRVRFIALLSPTCPMCRRGFSEMQKVLNNISDDHLRAYIVWLPILQGDDRASAVERSTEFSDERLTYFWDGERLTGDLWQRILDIGVIAWDVYFLYGPDVQWGKEPTLPEFWMHQLGGEVKAPYLNEEEFELKVKELLRKIK